MLDRSIRQKLNTAASLIQSAKQDLNTIPEIEAIQQLIQVCEAIDRHYREDFCPSVDDESGEEKGTTYKYGVCMEYYIEAEWWHNVSLALRKLRKGVDVL